MKKMIIDDEKSAVEYLDNVLKEWGSWRDHHLYLVQALETLLRINKSKSEALILKCEMINDMRAYINGLHKHIETLERSENGT